MKKTLMLVLISASSTVFAFDKSYIQNEIKEQEEIIAKEEGFFSEGCKEATDGYESCMNRLSFKYMFAKQALTRLKEDFAKRIKTEKAAKAEMAELSKGIVCSGKKGHVNIGMTYKEAIVCGWGKPQRVNRTTNSYGTREQWVYGYPNYLYFTNGVLTSFQN